ncbi:MAG: hypothetical protein O3C60_02015 [Planctomycetota bacterium]|nr:hypothetical protein [Planctomycetota bacterium]
MSGIPEGVSRQIEDGRWQMLRPLSYSNLGPELAKLSGDAVGTAGLHHLFGKKKL